MNASRLPLLHLGATVSLIALILLCVAWELFLAPIKVGGSWLVLKAVILLAPLMGILKGKRYTYQWASMLILLYLMEGLVRAWADTGLSQQLAQLEVLLAVVFFICTIYYAQMTGAKQSA